MPDAGLRVLEVHGGAVTRLIDLAAEQGKPPDAMSLMVAAAGAYLATRWKGMQDKKKEEEETVKQDAGVYMFFDEARTIREKVEEIVHGAAEHKAWLVTKVAVRTTAFYIENLGILCVDHEAHASVLIEHKKPGDKNITIFHLDGYAQKTTNVLPEVLREDRILCTQHEDASAVRLAVQAADEWRSKLWTWCEENFDKIKPANETVRWVDHATLVPTP